MWTCKEARSIVGSLPWKIGEYQFFKNIYFTLPILTIENIKNITQTNLIIIAKT